MPAPILPADGAAPLDPLGTGDGQPAGTPVEPIVLGASWADAGARVALGDPGLAASADSDDAGGISGARAHPLAPAGSSGPTGDAPGSAVQFGGSVVGGGVVPGSADSTPAGNDATAILNLGWSIPAGAAAASGDMVIAAGMAGGGAESMVSGGGAASAAPLGALSEAGGAETGTGSPAAALAGTGLIINLVYDAHTLSTAPASFFTGMQDAANMLEAAISNSITVNIDVGYGEYDGGPAFPDQNISEGDINSAISETYSSLRTLLANNETSSADIISVNALPNTTSLNGVSNFFIGSAEAKALGTVAANDTAIDGFVGMGTNFTGSVLIGGALHEITHAMGRIDDASGLSLFRYTSPGSHDFTSNIPAAASYFSIDGGVTPLASFGVNSDPSDFLDSGPQVPKDPFDETVGGSKLTSIDYAMMDVLGFQVTSTSFTVSAGHTDSGIIVNTGDTEFVQSGGTSVAAYALSGGLEVVSAGGADRTARLGSGSEQDVFGSATSVIVNGGTQIVAAGGVASGGTVSNGGGQYANSGGLASGATVRAGGFQAVYGGTATATMVSGGSQFVASSGKAIGTIVHSGGWLDVFSAGTSSRTTISKGGSETVSSGSLAKITTIHSGGSEIVAAGGGENGGTVASGGIESVYGRASGGALASGGNQIVESGGVASRVTVKLGGSQTVFFGGTTRGTVLSGGVEAVHGSASGGTVDSGGTETVYWRASGGTINGGVLEVASGGTASGTVTFIGGGTLQLDALTGFTGAIAGLTGPSPQDLIDLRAIAFTSGATTESFAQNTTSSGILTVSSGTHSASLTLLGAYTTSSFTLATDTHGGTLVTDPPVAGSAPRLTFADIAPAGLRAGAATTGNPTGSLPGAIAPNEQAYAGQTLLATGPPGRPDSGDHHPLPPGPP